MNASNMLDNDLSKCQNMEQVLEVVNKHYDLTKPFAIESLFMNHKFDAEKAAVAEQIQSILDQINKA